MIADEHGEAFVIEADVTRDEDCRRVVAQTVERYGSIAILHHIVGIGASGSVVDTDEALWADPICGAETWGTLGQCGRGTCAAAGGCWLAYA